MATAVFVQYKNSVDDTDDPNDDVFSSTVTTNPSGRVSPPGIPNNPRTKKKHALPSVLKETTNPSIWNRYQSCNGDIQINGRYDVDEPDKKIVVDHFEALQHTLKACRESLDRIDRFRSQPDRKRRLAYAARSFGLTTKPSPLVTSHHSASDVTAAGNRCVVESANTCSPVASGTDTCSTRGHEAAPLPWYASSGSSSSPPTSSPTPLPTGDTLSTSPPTASPTTSSTTPVGSTPTVSPSPHSPTHPDSPTTPVKSATPTTPIEVDFSTSSENSARPSTPFIQCKALPFTSPYAVGTANTQVSPSTDHPPPPHPSSSALPRPIPSPSAPNTTSSPSSSSSSSFVPNQPPGSAPCHVPSNSAAPTPPLSPHPHLHDNQGRLDIQKNTRSRPQPGGLEPRGRSHSDGGEAESRSGKGAGNGKGVMQAEVEEIKVEFEEAVGMAERKDLADLVESAVDEMETAMDGDEEEDDDDDDVEGAGTWSGSLQAVNGFVHIMNDDKMEPSSGGSGQREWSSDCGALSDCHAFERRENFASPWPEDYGEDTLDRLTDVTESEKDHTTRFLNQRHSTCLYRGKRTRMEREAKFGGKLRVRFADTVGRERENNEEKDSCERRNRICAASDLEEHMDWLQVEDLDHRMNHVEENVLYILDHLLKADDRKVGRYDTFDSGHGSRDAETSTREDSSTYYHHHYHHHHHLSHSIIVMFIICMIFILCILLLLPVVARTVTLAYVPGQPVF